MKIIPFDLLNNLNNSAFFYWPTFNSSKKCISVLGAMNPMLGNTALCWCLRNPQDVIPCNCTVYHTNGACFYNVSIHFSSDKSLQNISCLSCTYTKHFLIDGEDIMAETKVLQYLKLLIGKCCRSDVCVCVCTSKSLIVVVS